MQPKPFAKALLKNTNIQIILVTNQASLQKITQDILEMKPKINIKTVSDQEFLELPEAQD